MTLDLASAPGAVAIETLIDRLEAEIRVNGAFPTRTIRDAIRVELTTWAVQCRAMTGQLADWQARAESLRAQLLKLGVTPEAP